MIRMNKFDNFIVKLCIENDIILYYTISTTSFVNSEIQNEVMNYVYKSFDFSKFNNQNFNEEIYKDFFDEIKKIILHTKQKLINNIIFL